MIDHKFPWWIAYAVGVLVVAAGLGLVIWPFIAASWLLVILIGAALIANGLAIMMRGSSSGATVAGGVVLLLLGVLAIVFAEFTVNALVAFVGVTLMIVGAFWLVVGIRFGASAFVLLPAVLTIAGGIVTMVWPGFALSFVAVLGGLFTVVLGASIIWAASRLRRMRASDVTIQI